MERDRRGWQAQDRLLLGFRLFSRLLRLRRAGVFGEGEGRLGEKGGLGEEGEKRAEAEGAGEASESVCHF